MKAIRVVVIDGQPLFCDGVIYTLDAVAGIEVVGSGRSAQDAIRLAQHLQPDVLVLDVNVTGDGFAAVEAIVSSEPQVAILVLTTLGNRDCVHTLSEIGARGFVLKGIDGRELIEAISAVAGGGLYVSPSLAGELHALDDGAVTQPSNANPFTHLTLREEQILLEIGHGLSNKEIAAKLHISEKTVKHYVTGVLAKLRVRNRVAAALMVAFHGSDFLSEEARL